MNRYDIAVFDVDGTLLNTREGILLAVQDTMKQCGLREITKEEEPLFIGPPIQESLIKVFGMSTKEAQETANIFRAMYKEDGYLLKAIAYEGIIEVMEALLKQGVKVAVATYKRHDYAVKICNHFGFNNYSNIIYGADNENKLKKLDIIELCLKDLGAKDYRRAVMIGDSSFDAIGAEQIGTDFIGVTYGFDFKTKEDVDQFPNIGTAYTPMEILKFF
jgi:phosphoglycolate phosphatase